MIAFATLEQKIEIAATACLDAEFSDISERLRSVFYRSIGSDTVLTITGPITPGSVMSAMRRLYIEHFLPGCVDQMRDKMIQNAMPALPAEMAKAVAFGQRVEAIHRGVHQASDE